MKEKIIEMLGAGVSPVQVALACGVGESYISQILADENCARRVAELRVEKASAYVEHDAAVDSDEEAARKMVRRNLDTGMLKPMEVLAHFKVLNAARRKSDGVAGANTPTSTVVVLQMPAVAQVQFKLTTDKQVIEVDGRSMTPMPATQVARMLREQRAKKDLDHITDATVGGKEPAGQTLQEYRIAVPALIDTL